MKLRVLVGMEAEMTMGHLVESLKKDGNNSVDAIKSRFLELSAQQNEFYDRVINEYFGSDEKFKGAMYHPKDYLKNQEHEDAQRNIYLMLRNQLVQRFESSFGAFRKSVENVRKSMVVARRLMIWNSKKKDPKARKLVKVLDEVLKDENASIPMEANSPRRKVLVFSAYADTITHIAEYVEKKFPGKLIKIPINCPKVSIWTERDLSSTMTYLGIRHE